MLIIDTINAIALILRIYKIDKINMESMEILLKLDSIVDQTEFSENC